uniref:Uncharacterized protein n=1 Tax=viral metagenome TaxID=1070528 RepID=A0A6H1ZQ10_9ZZZZ
MFGQLGFDICVCDRCGDFDTLIHDRLYPANPALWASLGFSKKGWIQVAMLVDDGRLGAYVMLCPFCWGEAQKIVGLKLTSQQMRNWLTGGTWSISYDAYQNRVWLDVARRDFFAEQEYDKQPITLDGDSADIVGKMLGAEARRSNPRNDQDMEGDASMHLTKTPLPTGWWWMRRTPTSEWEAIKIAWQPRIVFTEDTCNTVVATVLAIFESQHYSVAPEGAVFYGPIPKPEV